MSKIGKEIFKGKRFSITPASPDHPIYSRGLMIGGTTSKKSSKDAPEDTPKPEKENK